MWPWPRFVSILKERQTGLGETYGVDGQLLHVALLPLFVPSDRKTDRSRRAKGRWMANSYMWPPYGVKPYGAHGASSNRAS